MSLQDDYFDVLNALEEKPEKTAFERIWLKVSEYETKEMVEAGELTESEYKQWMAERKTLLASSN